MLDVQVVRDKFQQYYGIHPRLIVRAPGRVNLIGEHTDYNDGFVFPVAIDYATYVAARPRDDNRVHIVALDLAREDEFDLEAIEHSADQPWSDYIRGVAKGLQVAGHTLGGVNLLITSNVPRGAGLSSSAALEVSVGYAFQLLNRLNILGEELALLAQGAENSFVGVQSGIMDQFISVLGRADHALLLDCRDLNYRLVPIPATTAIVVCDSRVERTLAGSAYNQRRKECGEAVRLFQPVAPQDHGAARSHARTVSRARGRDPRAGARPRPPCDQRERARGAWRGGARGRRCGDLWPADERVACQPARRLPGQRHRAGCAG